MNTRIDRIRENEKMSHTKVYTDEVLYNTDRLHEGLHVLYLELGVGANTSVIIKYPFWQMTMANDKSVYACLNYGEAFCPGEI